MQAADPRDRWEATTAKDRIMTSLPQSISDDFSLRCVIPRIWTQEQSRSFGIYWSKKTDHGVLYPSPTDEELADFYRQDHYDIYLSGELAAQYEAPLTIPYRVLIKIAYLNDKSVPDPIPTILTLSPAAPRVCDLGCGGGNFLDTIRAKGASVVGIDPSDVSGAAVVKKGIDFHTGTGENIPAELPREAFDVVTMFHSLEHCRDVALSLRNARDLLKPGGLCIIEVPNMECLGFQKYPGSLDPHRRRPASSIFYREIP
jgi:2-polyprenyl-3-methyl-5-hydroxy-6-metoxy-1,4-benzoquinol methylase